MYDSKMIPLVVDFTQ
jgi:hypothetical protein